MLKTKLAELRRSLEKADALAAGLEPTTCHPFTIERIDDQIIAIDSPGGNVPHGYSGSTCCFSADDRFCAIRHGLEWWAFEMETGEFYKQANRAAPSGGVLEGFLWASRGHDWLRVNNGRLERMALGFSGEPVMKFGRTLPFLHIPSSKWRTNSSSTNRVQFVTAVDEGVTRIVVFNDDLTGDFHSYEVEGRIHNASIMGATHILYTIQGDNQHLHRAFALGSNESTIIEPTIEGNAWSHVATSSKGVFAVWSAFARGLCCYSLLSGRPILRWRIGSLTSGDRYDQYQHGAWSPDGERFVFSTREPRKREVGLYVRGNDNATLRPIIEPAMWLDSKSGFNGQSRPSISNGGWVAFINDQTRAGVPRTHILKERNDATSNTSYGTVDRVSRDRSGYRLAS